MTSASQIAEFEADGLIDALAAGRYGGTTLEGPSVRAMVHALVALGWTPDPRALAGALPFFRVGFGVLDIRSTLRRLGFASRVRIRRGTRVMALPTGSIVTPHTGQHLVLSRPLAGASILRDAMTGAPVDPQTLGRCQCLTFSAIPPSGRATEGWTRSLWGRFRKEVAELLAVSFLSSGLVVIASLSTVLIFDTVLPSKAYDTLTAILVGLVALFLVELRLRRIRAFGIARVAGRMDYLLGTALFAKLLALPTPMLTSTPVNDQITRLRQFETVRQFIQGPFAAIALELPIVLFLLAFVFAISPELGGLTSGLLALYVAASALLVPAITRASRAQVAARRTHAEVLTSAIEHRAQIGQSGLGDTWRARLRPLTLTLVEARRRSERLSRLLATLAAAITPVSSGSIAAIGALLAMNGTLTGGQLLATMILSTRLFAPVQQAAVAAARLPEMLSLIRQIDTLMSIETPVYAPHGRSRYSDLEGTLQFEQVTLRYPGSNDLALAGVSLKIEANTFVLLNGASGSGKTTLFRAALGLYPVQAGRVLLGGINIAQLDRRSLIAKVGHVGDRPFFIHGTVAENLSLTRPHMPREKLAEITEELGILDGISAMPDGFDTRLTEAGWADVPPSTRRLLAVARGLLQEPSILLLDEAFSGLDTAQEARLIDALERRRRTTTIVLISERPSHANLADEVVTLKFGRVAPGGARAA
ncbi:MAG: ATP-binding cassette domain-containing protein [Pseudomonadota bacterium]